MKKIAIVFFCIFVACCAYAGHGNKVWEDMWVYPSEDSTALPVWGFKEGIRIGIAPMGGPRGLIRIYTPYISTEQPYRVMNFIAIEPIPVGSDSRGLSELEWSRWDKVQGKRFWSGNTPEPEKYRNVQRPATGNLQRDKSGGERLSVYIFSEPFDNGAETYVMITFTKGQPYEFEIRSYTTDKSVPLKKLIVTATMGNYARLRVLHLANHVQKISTQLWPEYQGDGFVPHDVTPVSQMMHDRHGHVWFVASPNERHPQQADYTANTGRGWRYEGESVTQYWRCEQPDRALVGQVNGRYCYWASHEPIPGGIAYENFELVEPFVQGQAFVFGVSPDRTDKLLRLSARY